ncbi:MAG: FAD-dependent oxidoreductase [Sporomusaceae bacterium]|nr:FAD-dependent oxidoreductase [Sporomusaceae bacterium]
MKIVIIGGVAAGTSAAAKARRNDETAEIDLFDADTDISYSSCGLPYYIGTGIENREQLVPRDAAFFKKKYNVNLYTLHKVLEIRTTEKLVLVENLLNGEIFEKHYDKLVLATGAQPIKPPLPGMDKQNVFLVRNVASADKLRTYIQERKPKRAVIVGSGFIGLEMAENLTARGLYVTIVEMAPYIMPALDLDMSVYIEDHLKAKQIRLFTANPVVYLEGKDTVEQVCLQNGQVIPTDFVIMAVGVRPNVELAQRAGIALGVTGAIAVNSRMETNLEGIYACGDCAESYSLITKQAFYRPLGSTANKIGRIVGDQMTGGNLEFRGGLGTGIFKVFDLTVAQTGLTEKEAHRAGYEVVVCHNIKPDKPEYFHGKEMIIKAIADQVTGRILGAQIVGFQGVDKRIDVFVTAISFGAKAEDLFHLDLAYAPPFSTTKDPVIYTGMILENTLNRGRRLITPDRLSEKIQQGEDIQIIDARIGPQYEDSHIVGARNIPQDELRNTLHSLDKEKPTVTYCNKGVTGNATQNILINAGFKEVYNLSGGHKHYNKIIGGEVKK